MPETFGSFWRDGAAQRRACHGKAFPRPLTPGSCAWRRAGHAIWAEAFDAYRSLAGVERTFRSAGRPADPSRTYVFRKPSPRPRDPLHAGLHVESHMPWHLAPMPFKDDDRLVPGAAQSARERGRDLGVREGQGEHEVHSRRAAGPQSRDASRRPRHPAAERGQGSVGARPRLSGARAAGGQPARAFDLPELHSARILP